MDKLFKIRMLKYQKIDISFVNMARFADGNAPTARQLLAHAQGAIAIGRERAKITATPEIEELITQNLREVFRPGLYVLGHGTKNSKAEQILKEGLLIRGDHLDSTTLSLLENPEDHGKFDVQSSGVVNLLLNWHSILGEVRDAVVVIALPTPVTPYRQPNPFLRYEQRDSEGRSPDHVLPSNYIFGYVNSESLEFVRNPGFDPVKQLQNERELSLKSNLVDISTISAVIRAVARGMTEGVPKEIIVEDVVSANYGRFLAGTVDVSIAHLVDSGSLVRAGDRYLPTQEGKDVLAGHLHYEDELHKKELAEHRRRIGYKQY